MKFEQACRFATSDSGYRIFAQSKGFSDQNASNMTVVFNDVMNPVFGRVGQSMITLNISNNDVFFARLTLRSDIKSRKSMFTNAAVIPFESYSRMMVEDPAWMIHFPYNDLLSQRAGNESMAPIEFEEYLPKEDTLESICKEYDLGRSALTEFIIQLYRAVTEGASLCLVTDLDSARTPDLVIKYAALAASLLPFSLRRTLTFSSMGDARCVLCVQPRDGGELLGRGREVYKFQADPGGRHIYKNEAREVDMQNGMADMLVNFANLLGSYMMRDRTELERFLNQLDEKANTISGTQRGCFSFALLMVSYYLAEGKSISLIEAVYLINALLQYVQGNEADDKCVNQLLIELINVLSNAGVCANINIAAPLTVRSIDQEDELLYSSVCSMLKYAADETRIKLAQIILNKEYSERQKTLVNMLLIANPAPWSDELLEMTFAWSCRYNITDLAPVIWERKNDQINKQSDADSEAAGLLHRLIKDNIRQEQGLLQLPEKELLFNECEMFYMQNGLTEICDGVNVAQPEEVLSDDEVRIVSSNFNDFSEPLQQSWISYLVIFRYCAGRPLDQQVFSLKNMAKTAPDVFDKVCEALKSGQGAGASLLEAYWTDTLLRKCSSIKDIAAVCDQYNVSRDPDGIMEKQVKQAWLDKVVFDDADSLKEKMDFLINQYDTLEKAQLSSETRLYLKEKLTLRFWECVSLRQLMDGAQKAAAIQYLSGHLKRLEYRANPIISRKLIAYYYVADAFMHPKKLSNHVFFKEIVETGSWRCRKAAEDFKEIKTERHQGELRYSYPDIEMMQKEIMQIAKRHLVNSNVFYLDYYLIGTYYKDETRPDDEGYDLEAFREKVNRLISGRYLNDRTEISLEDSVILNEEDTADEFRKSIRKLINKNDPLSLRRFAEKLKRPKKGIFSFFGRKEADDRDDTDQEEYED